MDASIFIQAVDTLHSPTATPAQRASANDWLVAFAADAEAPSVCEAVLRCPDGQTGSGHLLATAFMDTLMLLATLCADDAVRIIFFPLASRCTLLSG